MGAGAGSRMTCMNAKQAGEKAALPFTLKPAPLLSVLHNRKLNEKQVLKNLSSEKTEVKQNFQATANTHTKPWFE